jgi:hypothetical protein
MQGERRRPCTLYQPMRITVPLFVFLPFLSNDFTWSSGFTSATHPAALACPPPGPVAPPPPPSVGKSAAPPDGAAARALGALHISH